MTNGHINPANVPDIALKDGHSIPQVGLGVLRIDDEGVVPVVESALEAGYRHIDGAAGYNNEAGVAARSPLPDTTRAPSARPCGSPPSCATPSRATIPRSKLSTTRWNSSSSITWTCT